MKKVVSILLVAAVLLSTMLTYAASAENKGTVTILSVKDGWKPGFDEVAAQIEENYGISIDLTLVADDAFADILGVKLATGDAPDIFLGNCPQIVEQFNAPETCVALDDQPWIARLVDADFLRYTGDGHIYAMPTIDPSNFYGGIYYNADVMEACGIIDPNPKTYAEFLEICETVKAAGYTPIYMTDADNWTTQVWTTVGWGVVLDYCKDTIYDQLNNNEIDFQDVPELVDVLQKLQDLYTAGYVNDDHLSAAYETGITALGEQKAAMVVQGEWFVSAAKAAYPEIRLGSFAIPFIDGEDNMIGVGAYITGLWVTKDGQTDLALEFLNLWSQPEQMEVMYSFQGVPSAWIDCEGGDIDPCVNKFLQDYIANGKYTYEFDSYFDSARPIMTDYLFGNITECVAGSKTPEEALTDWNEKFEQYMAEMEVEGF